jgi:hypothetical protein
LELGKVKDIGDTTDIFIQSFIFFFPQAFECRLCYVRPAFGEWDEEANNRFSDLTWDKKLVAKVKHLHDMLE